MQAFQHTEQAMDTMQSYGPPDLPPGFVEAQQRMRGVAGAS